MITAAGGRKGAWEEKEKCRQRLATPLCHDRHAPDEKYRNGSNRGRHVFFPRPTLVFVSDSSACRCRFHNPPCTLHSAFDNKKVCALCAAQLQGGGSGSGGRGLPRAPGPGSVRALRGPRVWLRHLVRGVHGLYRH